MGPINIRHHRGQSSRLGNMAPGIIKVTGDAVLSGHNTECDKCGLTNGTAVQCTMYNVLMYNVQMYFGGVGLDSIYQIQGNMNGPRWLNRCSDTRRAGRSGDQHRCGEIFPAPVQTGPVARPTSCTMGFKSLSQK